MAPDEEAFRAHMSTGRFLIGVDEGEWRLLSITWPHAVIAVSAAPRAGAPDEYFFRFELANYPTVAVTAAVWHPEQQRLATDSERPKMSYAPNPANPFRGDWMAGSALYIPCDRVAIQGHPEWSSLYPGDLWDPAKGISKYLIYIHRRLHEDAYTGL